jgi:hypothetical protein
MVACAAVRTALFAAALAPGDAALETLAAVAVGAREIARLARGAVTLAMGTPTFAAEATAEDYDALASHWAVLEAVAALGSEAEAGLRGWEPKIGADHKLSWWRRFAYKR